MHYHDPASVGDPAGGWCDKNDLGYPAGWYAYDPDLDDARPVPDPRIGDPTGHPDRCGPSCPDCAYESMPGADPLTLEGQQRLEDAGAHLAPVKCWHCGGTASDPADGSTCPACGGSGWERE
jgi:hypothetical protein